jgi:hypothetical protein
MRTVTALFVLLLIAGAALAQDRLSSPYQQQAETAFADSTKRRSPISRQGLAWVSPGLPS